MRKKIVTVSIMTLCLIAPLIPDYGLAEETLPCPDDCIVSFEVLWVGNESKEVRRSAIDDISRALVDRSDGGVAAARFREQTIVFLAFKQDCEDKDAQLETLLNDIFGFLNLGVEYAIRPGPFQRGRDTIRFNGDHWDQESCCNN